MKNNNYDISYSDKGNDEVTELVKSVEDMRIEIRENDKTKQEMLQNISHDFKTPIGVIKSYAEAMQDGHMLDKGPDVILKQSEILYNKTEQLITYNKLEYLTKDKEFESVNIRRIIESVEAQFKASRNDICFENNLEDVYFLGYADNYRIVIENIIDNALRYAKKIIKISLKEDRIEIYNDGEHIDSKFITDGFKAYEKGSNGKFGLGMSIVVKTLSFFGYRLIVKNEDVGVSFIICR
jgi:two-component system sensor histidine kinase CssS